jgi:hypothetical protein
MSEDTTSGNGKRTLTYKIADAPHGHLITAECLGCGKPLYVFVGDDGSVMEFHAQSLPSHPDPTGKEG